MTETTIYAELLNAATQAPGFQPYRSPETTSEYLSRLVRAVVNVAPQEAWDKLSDAAQTWCSEAATTINGGGNLPFCSGYEPANGPVAVEKPAEAPAKKAGRPKAEKPAKAEKPVKAAKVAAEKPVKAEKPAKTPKPVKEKAEPKSAKPESLMSTIRRLVLKNNDISVEAIYKELAVLGWDTDKIKKSSVSTTRGETASMVSLAKELGFWNDAA